MKYFQIMSTIQSHHNAIRDLNEKETEARRNMDAAAINAVTAEKSTHYKAIIELEEMLENCELTEEEIKEHFDALLGEE